MSSWTEEGEHEVLVIQESIHRKRLAMKKFNSHGDEQSRQEYREARCTTKREMAKEKRYVRMNTVEREKEWVHHSHLQSSQGLDTCAEDGERIWTQDFEDRAASKDEKKKTTEKVPGCSNGRHQEGWCERRGCYG